MSNKACELCIKPARMFCESDQARLCWDCDEKVHAANFLVAKHSRTLLCHSCSSPTPWKASGLKIGPAVSLCSACSEGEACGGAEGNGNEIQDRDSQESESDDGEYYTDEDEDEDEGEGDNQVVPWSICSSATAPTANEEGCYSSHNLDSNLASRSSSFQESENLDSSEQTLFRPPKMRRTDNGTFPSEPADSGQSPQTHRQLLSATY